MVETSQLCHGHNWACSCFPDLPVPAALVAASSPATHKVAPAHDPACTELVPATSLADDQESAYSPLLVEDPPRIVLSLPFLSNGVPLAVWLAGGGVTETGESYPLSVMASDSSIPRNGIWSRSWLTRPFASTHTSAGQLLAPEVPEIDIEPEDVVVTGSITR